MSGPRRIRTSLRWRLVVFAFSTSAVAVLIAAAAMVGITGFGRWANLIQTLNGQAMAIAETSNVALAFDFPEDATALLATMEANPAVVVAAVYDHEGKLFAFHDLGSVPPPRIDEMTPDDHTQRFLSRLVRVSQPVELGGDPIGMVVLEAESTEVVRGMARDAEIAFGIIVIVLGGAFLLVFRMQRSVSEPILELASSARSVTEGGDVSIRVVRRTSDETGDLVDAFNEMLSAIETRNRQLKELTAELERRVQERTAELESANGELESFSYSVSHDLRAPLRHIVGFIELVLEAEADRLSDTGRRHLGVIAGSATEMGVLIDVLLEFSRAGRAEMVKERVDLDSLAREVVDEQRENEHGAAIEWHMEKLPPAWGDRSLIRQVFANLIGNAVKYSSTRDPARIEIRNATTGGKMVEVEIVDNGVGFDPTYSHKLFGVFQRLHRAEDFKGEGIGLAIVHRIISRHGGEVRGKGEIDGGATFGFTLPAVEISGEKGMT